VNSPTNQFCSKCGAPLDLQTALEIVQEEKTTEDMMSKLFENHEFKVMVEKILKERHSWNL